jgi:hypothetical protein
MDIGKMFPSKFLKAVDLDGHEVTVTIECVDFIEVGWPKQRKGIVRFVGKQKGLILNRTNALAIAQIAGATDTDRWGGVKIRLCPARVKFGRDEVDAVRIVSPASPAAVDHERDRPGHSTPAPRQEQEPERRARERDDGVDRSRFNVVSGGGAERSRR